MLALFSKRPGEPETLALLAAVEPGKAIGARRALGRIAVSMDAAEAR